jgi:hypothetical protein
MSYFESLGLSEIHNLPTEDKAAFLQAQIDESRKIIYRHLVELEVADAARERAESESDEDLKDRLLSLVRTRTMEAREAIKQVRLNLDVNARLLEQLDAEA